MRPVIFLFTAAVLSLACSKQKPNPSEDPSAAVADSPEAQAQLDAEILGKDLFEVVDVVMSYRSSHSGHLPKTLRQVGLDSLTPVGIRRLAIQGSRPLVTIIFRRPGERRVATCQGTSELLEDASLNSGLFAIQCTMRSGDERTFHVGQLPAKQK